MKKEVNAATDEALRMRRDLAQLLANVLIRRQQEEKSGTRVEKT
ncbi:hypothetical protein P4B35_10130 [Pontiellaceae bacterium B12227]|nr:hypothetical protein [Pontiellaceae bacterium B12227]